jgi:YHS domain-containing protein
VYDPATILAGDCVMAGHRSRIRPLLSIALAAACCFGAVARGAEPAKPAVSLSQAQFGGQCVEGLATGRHVMTNCSVTWNDKDGKTYCFSSEAAKTEFLKDPAGNLERARNFIAASNVQSTEEAMQYFDSNDAETVVKSHVEDQLAGNGGKFPLEDALTGDKLQLAFDGIDFTRTIDGYGFFPDVKFHDAKDPERKYVIDFWVVPQNGQLRIQETRIYQAPQQQEGKWVTATRQPIPWWWIPASEHPGHMAQKRSWEVMSAVEQNALQASLKDGGVFRLKDDKTGKTLDLQFVDTHQPIRQLDDNGHFFACTDFRAVGSKDQIYDVDFWVSEKDGKLSVEQVKVHKVPELKNGQWVQVESYSWKDLGNSKVVP